MQQANRLDTVVAYHQRTKHHFRRYAAGPGGLDWASQPDPFRSFAGSSRTLLPLLRDGPHAPYTDLYSHDRIAAQPLSLHAVAALLELSFGISAWKEYEGTRWALRCNPSSGNLHPTEAYVVTEGCTGIEDGVHHYLSRDHLLEQRCRFAPAARENEHLLPTGSVLVGLTSIHWREAWKYGERAFRYCQHDAGHAIAAVRYAAAALGWQVRLLDAWGDADVAAVLGVDRDEDFGAAEREHPDLVLLVMTAQAGAAATLPPDALAGAAHRAQWQGHANVLSPHHLHQWPVIEEVAHACVKPRTMQTKWLVPARPAPLALACEESAAEIIRQRRSAQAFDGVTSISSVAFYRMLDMTLPRAGVTPWDAIGWEPRLHLLLFVHRVTGLLPGLYLFLRNDHIESVLRGDLSAEFEWEAVQDCPAHFAMFRLVAGNAQAAARTLSCHQDIAADGAFSLGMLAEYEAELVQGPWIYRRLFWEAGILGQVLYLEAEAAGVRGTGIGCYFDDEVHNLLGLQKQSLQSMYHFTTGAAIPDMRLQTLPAYAHLNR
jgi:SagB-type dehydrogenase family enzyme